MPLRLIFMGTPDFSVPTLLELVAHGHEIAAVYTRAPKPGGRGMKLQPTPVEVEARRLGDNAVTEGWAMLLELLVNEPAWLERRLDFARPADFAAEASAGQLYFVRRYSAKLLYELELHGEGDVESMRARYVERMHDALKIEFSEADYLADVDAGFYSSSYLRAWAFEAR